MENKIIAILIIANSIFLGSCASTPKQKSHQDVITSLNNINQLDLNNKNNVLIDVRTAEEYSEGHISKSINIDVNSSDFENKISALDPQKNYYIYCKSGARAKLATEKMKNNGIQKVYNFQDGFSTYKEKK